jgi:hypothetical protein
MCFKNFVAGWNCRCTFLKLPASSTHIVWNHSPCQSYCP